MIVLCGVTPFSLVEIYAFKITTVKVPDLTASHTTTYMCLGVLSLVEIHLARSELVHEKILLEVGLLQKVP